MHVRSFQLSCILPLLVAFPLVPFALRTEASALSDEIPEDEAAPSDIKDDDGESGETLPQQPQPYEFTVTMKPGKMGIVLDQYFHSLQDGVIANVLPDTQAHDVGIQPSAVIIKLDDVPFSQKALTPRKNGKKNYTMTLVYKNWLFREVTLAWKLWLSLLCIAVAVGVCWFAFALFDGARLVEAFDHPVVLLAIMTLLIGEVERNVWSISYSWQSTNLVEKFAMFAKPFPILGTALGLHVNWSMPLFKAPLAPDASTQLRIENTLVWLVGLSLICAIWSCKILAAYTIISASTGTPRHASGPLWDCLFVLSNLCYDTVWWSLTLAYLTTTNHVCYCIAQRLEFLANALPCKAAEFKERLRDPCVKFFDELDSELEKMGVPLVCTLLAFPRPVMRLWKLRMDVKHGQIFATYDGMLWYGMLWLQDFVEVLLLALVVAATSQRLHSALIHLRGILNNTRRSDPELHLPVQDVETMFDQANDGKGWGISVYRKLVVDRDLILKLGLTALTFSFAAHHLLMEEHGYMTDSKILQKAAESTKTKLDAVIQKLDGAINKLEAT